MTARVSFAERAKQFGLVIVWIAFFLLVGFAGSFVLVRLIPKDTHSNWEHAAQAVVLAVSFGFATWLVGVRFGKQSWDHWGWHTEGGLIGRIVRGIGLGGVMAAVAIGLSFVGSRATFRIQPEWSRWLEAAAPFAVLLLAAALFEELVFRGYPLRRLADAVGSWAATAVLAVGFGIAHLWNPNVTLFSTVNIALAAVWLSFAFFSPGGMGYAWGLHFGWNAGLALVFDAPVSGLTFDLPAVEYDPGTRAWVDGGAFGPEGGLVATVVLIAGTLAVIGGRFRQPKEWLV